MCDESSPIYLVVVLLMIIIVSYAVQSALSGGKILVSYLSLLTSSYTHSAFAIDIESLDHFSHSKAVYIAIVLCLCSPRKPDSIFKLEHIL